jgi:hypothetical protein
VSVQIKTERNTEGSFLYVAFPEIRCDVRQRKVNTMNPGTTLHCIRGLHCIPV